VRTEPNFKSKSNLSSDHIRDSGAGDELITLPVGLTTAEFRCLLDELTDEPFRTIVIASACLGLRGSEVTVLQWGDFSPDGSTLTVHGELHGRAIDLGHFRGRLPVCPQLAQVFSEWKSTCRFSEDTNWVFAGRYEPQKHHDPVRVLSRIKAAGKYACLRREIGWHTIRCTLATALISLGFDLQTVCRLMRNKTVETTLLMFTHNRTPNSQTGLHLGTDLKSVGASPECLADAAAQVAHVLLPTIGPGRVFDGGRRSR
jgi:integrase